MAKINLPSWTVEPGLWTLYMAFCAFSLYDGLTGDEWIHAWNGAMGVILGSVGLLYAAARVNSRYDIVGVGR